MSITSWLFLCRTFFRLETFFTTFLGDFFSSDYWPEDDKESDKDSDFTGATAFSSSCGFLEKLLLLFLDLGFDLSLSFAKLFP
jgi:hypothetical protein